MAIAMISKASKWFSRKRVGLGIGSKPKPKSPPPPSLSPVAKGNEFRRVFSHFDADNDGRISAEELRGYFASVGECMPYEDAGRVISEFDVDGDSLLEYKDFLQLMERNDNEGGGGGCDDEDLRRAFEMYEVDKGCGCISPKSLQRVLNRLGDFKSEEECESMISVFDLDGNGVLDFNEFHEMMMMT